MKLTLTQKLSFCRICKNAEFSLKEGINCKLTGKKPAFEKHCEKFIPVSDDVEIPDFSEKKDTRSKEKIYLDSINTFLSSRNYSISKYHNKKFSEKELDELPKIYRFELSIFFPILHILGGIFVLSVMVYLSKDFEINKINKGTLSVFFYIAFGIFLFFLGMNQMKQKQAKDYLTDKGIYLHNKPMIRWKDIEYILKAKSDENEFIAVKKYKEQKPLILFSPKRFKLESYEVLELLEQYRQKFSRES